MKKRISLRTRILRMFILMMLGLFAVISLFFNFVLHRYINSEIGRQLQSAVERVDRSFPAFGESPPAWQEEQPSLPEMADGAGIVAREVSHLSQVQAFLVSEDYTIQVPRANADEVLLERTQQLIDVIEENRIPLDDRQQHSVHAGGRDYVMTGTRVQWVRAFWGAPVTSSMSVVFYIDSTGLNQLLRTVNVFLLIIILVLGSAALVLTVLMTGRIVRPIRALSEFAVALGNGDYRQREFETRDRELLELKTVMNQTAAQLEKYDSDQKIFFQNVSHELRTPLMSIKGYTEGIQYNMFEDNSEATDVILNETDRLTDMVEDLIYISKIDNIKTDSVQTECDFREVISRSGGNLKGILLRSDVQVKYLFPPEPVPVTCDERQCERAFGNILSNGLRYAKSRILVTCREEGGMVIVTVQDDGGGIDEEALPRIFDRFYKGRQGKHGIGLSMAKTVFEHHGGTLTAQNNEIGALFTICMPRSRGEELV